MESRFSTRIRDFMTTKDIIQFLSRINRREVRLRIVIEIASGGCTDTLYTEQCIEHTRLLPAHAMMPSVCGRCRRRISEILNAIYVKFDSASGFYERNNTFHDTSKCRRVTHLVLNELILNLKLNMIIV